MKAYEIQFFRGDQVGIQEWDENGTLIPVPPVPAGLVRIWQLGELEMFYVGKSREVIHLGFGEPIKVLDSSWLYGGLAIGGKRGNVEFEFNENGVVGSVKVTFP